MSTSGTLAATQRLLGLLRATGRLAFRAVVCVITFFVVFSVCEGIKDLLFY